MGIQQLTGRVRELRRRGYTPKQIAMSVALITLLYLGVAMATAGTGTYGGSQVNRTAIAHVLSGTLRTPPERTPRSRARGAIGKSDALG
jgi:amino acid transporter